MSSTPTRAFAPRGPRADAGASAIARSRRSSCATPRRGSTTRSSARRIWPSSCRCAAILLRRARTEGSRSARSPVVRPWRTSSCACMAARASPPRGPATTAALASSPPRRRCSSVRFGYDRQGSRTSNGKATSRRSCWGRCLAMPRGREGAAIPGRLPTGPRTAQALSDGPAWNLDGSEVRRPSELHPSSPYRSGGSGEWKET